MSTITPAPLFETKIPRTSAGRLIGEVAESAWQDAEKLRRACADLPETEANIIRTAGQSPNYHVCDSAEDFAIVPP